MAQCLKHMFNLEFHKMNNCIIFVFTCSWHPPPPLNPFLYAGALEGVGPGNRDFLGPAPDMATSEASAIWAQESRDS
jgi:hypothetical protein